MSDYVRRHRQQSERAMPPHPPRRRRVGRPSGHLDAAGAGALAFVPWVGFAPQIQLNQGDNMPWPQAAAAIGNVAVLGAIYEPPAEDRPQMVYMPDEFRFLDLGAGIPERMEP